MKKQDNSNAAGPVPCVIQPDEGKVFKLRAAAVYVERLYAGADFATDAAAALFDEVPDSQIPRADPRIAAQRGLLAAAGVDVESVAHETPGDGETPQWAAGEFVRAGQVRRHGDDCYKAVQTHVAQPDWPPSATPALWTRAPAPAAPGAPPPPWAQPAGAHDAYAIGDRVTHDGKTWESAVAGNVYAPGVVAGQWTEIT
jgi:hypothetical protein